MNLTTRTYNVMLKFTMDETWSGPQSILQTMGWEYGQIYAFRGDYDKYSFLTEIKIEETNYMEFTATLTFTIFNPQEQGDVNPLLQPIEVAWGFRDQEVVQFLDYDGNPIVNTAGEFFDPPITEPMSIPLLTIQRNEPIGTYSPAKAYTYRGAVNSDTFAGEDPGKCKVLQISGKRLYNPICRWYFQVTYEFEFNPDGFRRHVPSMGYRQLSKDQTKLEQIVVQGSPASNPMCLDENGRWNLTPYIMEFQTRAELPFQIFNFDDDILQGLK